MRRGTSSAPLRTLLVGGALVLLRLPFLATGHLQEDALISFRCARQLADTGVYGFNLGEKVSASTSHLLVFVATAFRLLSGERFVWWTCLALTIALVSGLGVLCARLARNNREFYLTWIASAALPVALEASFTGMETGLLIGALGYLLGNLGRHPRRAAAVAAVVPWIRPEALVFVFLAGLVCWKHARRVVLAGSAGLAAVVAFNLLYFGHPIHQTIVAKWVAGGAMRSPAARLTGSLSLLFSGGPFLPLPTKYLEGFGLLSLAAMLLLWALAIFETRGDRWRRALIIALVACAVLPILAYGMGGVIFPWYLWPSALLGSVAATWAIVAGLERSPSGLRTAGFALGFVALCALVLARWVLSYSWGTLEGRYRAGIGSEIARAASSNSTLLLEPAGYIPFYARVETADEIGLVCPAVTAYRRAHGRRWWIEFVRDRRPEFIVERPHLRSGVTLDGEMLWRGEREWFEEHYRLWRSFRYEPTAYASSSWQRKILSLGSASEYDVYRLESGERPGPRPICAVGARRSEL